MMGMEMMIKNMLGIDPEELKEQAALLIGQAQETAQQINQRVMAIELMLATVAKNQNILYGEIKRLQEAAGITDDKPTPALTHEANNDDSGNTAH